VEQLPMSSLQALLKLALEAPEVSQRELAIAFVTTINPS
jgi:hypothetical protein